MRVFQPDLDGMDHAFKTQPFGQRSKRAQAFKKAIGEGSRASAFISTLSKRSAHAVRMVESCPMLFALYYGDTPAHATALRLEHAGDVRTVLRRLEIPYCLRKLHPHAMHLLLVGDAGRHGILPKAHRSYAATKLMLDLSLLPQGLLSQCIPEDVDAQAEWARWIAAFQSSHRRRVRPCQVDLEYIVRNAVMLNEIFGNFTHWHDFCAALDKPYDVRWGKKRLTREKDAWEARFRLERAARETFRTKIVEGFPENAIEEPFRFRALLSAAALANEGSEMRHCVAGYWAGVRDQQYAIYSVQGPGGERGTLQLGPQTHSSARSHVRIHQLKGPHNRSVSKAMLEACERFALRVSRDISATLAPQPEQSDGLGGVTVVKDGPGWVVVRVDRLSTVRPEVVAALRSAADFVSSNAQDDAIYFRMPEGHWQRLKDQALRYPGLRRPLNIGSVSVGVVNEYRPPRCVTGGTDEGV